MRQKQDSLRQQINKVNRYLDLAEVILVELDDQARIVMIGGKGYEILGYESDELIGQNWFKVCLPEEEYEQVFSIYQQLMQGNIDNVEYFENEIITKQGEHRCIAWHNALSKDNSGHIIGTVSSGIDITERFHALEALKKSEAHFRNIIDASPVPYALNDEQQNITYLNPAFVRAFGYDLNDIPTLADWWPRAYPNKEYRNWVGKTWEQRLDRALKEGVEFEPFELKIRCKDGSTRFVMASASLLTEAYKGNHLIILYDITEHKQAERDVAALAERLDLATQAAHIGIWDWNVESNELNWDDRMFELYGVNQQSFGGAYDAWAAGVHPEDRDYAEQSVQDALEGKKPFDIEFRVCWPDGTIRYTKSAGQVIRDQEGHPLRMTGINYDITDRVQAQEQLQFIAHHDVLTGLPNRLLFMDRLGRALIRARRYQESIAVFYMDLDRFKNINDTFGHNTGDKFLKSIAGFLSTEIRSSDTIARLGGDEFAVIVENVSGAEDVILVAEKMLDTLAKPIKIDEHEFYVTTSIGISLFPNDSDDAEDLLKNADTAMYRAKELGRNNFQFYSEDLSTRALQRLTLEQDLRRALERDEFLLYYQPQVDLKTQRVIAIEALLRWNHPEYGLVSPNKFVAVAEETGLIVAIGQWVLTTACTQLQTWQEQGLPVVPVTVNLSSRQFVDGTLASVVTQTLENTNLEPSLLELEITEGVMIHNPEKVTHTLQQMNEQGIRIAIDDFGTGYSSLSYLKRYPIDTLKIDQSFVHDLATDSNDASIVLAIIAMAHSMGLYVIAEGVETEEQLDFLKSHDCDSVQGFLFSHPLSNNAMHDYLLNGDRHY